jgi:hypothetical protein
MAKNKGEQISGAIGDVIYSSWKGRAYVKRRPESVANPRTEKQQSHRNGFGALSRLSSAMKEGHKIGLHAWAVREKLDTFSAFKKINKNCYSADGIDYARVCISRGSVGRSYVTSAKVDNQGVVHVTFHSNTTPENQYDQFFLFVCCPDQREGRCAAPVARTAGEVHASIPAEWMGHPLHLYAFMKAEKGNRTSDSDYVGQFCTSE